MCIANGSGGQFSCVDSVDHELVRISTFGITDDMHSFVRDVKIGSYPLFKGPNKIGDILIDSIELTSDKSFYISFEFTRGY